MTTRTMFTLWRPKDDPIAAYREHLLGTIAPKLCEKNLGAVTINIADIKAPTLNAKRATDRARVSALIEVTTPPDAPIQPLLDIVDPGGQMSAAYRVHQDIPHSYTRTWPLGQPSPGAKQVTFLRQHPALSYEAFLEHWFTVHTPLALIIHPLWRYSRNQVKQALTENAPDYDGIVGLHFRELRDITDPMRLFGQNIENMQIIAKDVALFIDMPSIVVTTMTEYIFQEETLTETS